MNNKNKSLDERLYDDFYRGFEMDKKSNGILSKRASYLGKYLRNFCGAGVIGLSSYFVHRSSNSELTTRELIIEGGLIVTATGLMVHMHNVEKIFKAMYRKNVGENLAQKKIVEVKKAGKIGRHAHLCAATAMLGVLGTLMYTMPIVLIVAPILPLWYNYTIRKGYGALYSSAVDYTAGQRE